MRVGLKDTPERVYTLGDGHTPLKISDWQKGIGVIIDCKLNVEHHIAAKINKANSVLEVIHHTFQYKNERTGHIIQVSGKTPEVCKPSLGSSFG